MDKYNFIPQNKEEYEEQQIELVCKTIVANLGTNIYDGRNRYAPRVAVCQKEDGRLYWGRDNVILEPSDDIIRKALAIFKEKGYFPYYDNDVCFYKVVKDKSEVRGEWALKHTCWL